MYQADIHNYPACVTSIGYSAFYGCTRLISALILSSTIITIQGDTFRECSSLVFIVIPSSVSSIESYAFDSYTALTNVTFAGSNTAVYYYRYDSETY